MLRPRIIPCLLIRDKGLVKTTKFKETRYLGDPINAVRIFNEKQADELMLLDIDASRENREPDYKMIERIASECRMPLCYGGGIRSVAQAQRIFASGVEKISINTAALQHPELIGELAGEAGSQSVAVTLDVKRKLLGGYEVWTHNRAINTKASLETWIRKFENHGAGEIIINAIDRDGTLKGYDMHLCDEVFKATSVPVTFLGGAGALSDLSAMVERYGSIGVAAGSLFVYKGAFKAVLINYPNKEEKLHLCKSQLR